MKNVPVIIEENWSPDAAEDGSRALAPGCGSYLCLKILNKDSHSRALYAAVVLRFFYSFIFMNIFVHNE